MGALGCERDGTNIFVRPNDLDILMLSSAERADSSFMRSEVSSSWMCWARFCIRDWMVGRKFGSVDLRLWNFLSCSLTCVRFHRQNYLFKYEMNPSLRSDAPHDPYPLGLFHL